MTSASIFMTWENFLIECYPYTSTLLTERYPYTYTLLIER